MRPDGLKTKIFLDSGDQAETKEIMDLLGFVDGQTTNPSLFAKNPDVRAKLATGEKFSKDEIFSVYRQIVTDISTQIPNGSVSVEVYADANTGAEEILRQAREMNTWIPNAHIKLPITKSGLEVAEILVKEGIRVNMTLAFSQNQAAAVYAATRGAVRGQVFLSPFVGRLDDRGEDGMSFIKNVIEMFHAGDHHVEVLSASVRTYAHLLRCLQLESDIVTAPGKILKEWSANDFYIPASDWKYDAGALRPLPYEEVGLNKDWREYDIHHDLTDAGLEKFAGDWNGLSRNT
ncbi:MAG: transaldolase [Candidatus Magasanikbacteria bacterium]|nr:transaldolase [Candidatus Magasanikbacteria bacterium]